MDRALAALGRNVQISLTLTPRSHTANRRALSVPLRRLTLRGSVSVSVSVSVMVTNSNRACGAGSTPPAFSSVRGDIGWPLDTSIFEGLVADLAVLNRPMMHLHRSNPTTIPQPSQTSRQNKAGRRRGRLPAARSAALRTSHAPVGRAMGGGRHLPIPYVENLPTNEPPQDSHALVRHHVHPPPQPSPADRQLRLRSSALAYAADSGRRNRPRHAGLG
jgi:hypothetical protein